MADIDAIWGQPAAERRIDYDAISIALHWCTLVLLIVLFAAGWTLVRVEDDRTSDILLLIHRSAGLLVWIATLVRLLWKVTAARKPRLPLTVPRLQQRIARANQWALYLLLIAQPITGFVQSIAYGDPFPILGFTVPSVMSSDKSLAHMFESIHSVTAWILLVIVGLHACAALFHGFVLKDGVFASMLPARTRSSN